MYGIWIRFYKEAWSKRRWWELPSDILRCRRGKRESDNRVLRPTFIALSSILKYQLPAPHWLRAGNLKHENGRIPGFG